jgi:hypothetical protein
MKKIILQNHFNPYANKDHHANINAKQTRSNINLNHGSNLQYNRSHNNGFKNINNIKTNNFSGTSTSKANNFTFAQLLKEYQQNDSDIILQVRS